MSREIKFRAWDKKYSVMLCTGFSIIGEVTLFSGVEIMLMEQSKKHNDSTPSLERLNDVEVMQFTGLKDTNGVDIYEGDIVAAKHRSKEIIHIGTIAMPKSCWVLETRQDEKTRWYRTAEFSKLEVLGNIHQNPELL